MTDSHERRQAFKEWTKRAVTKGVPVKEVMLTDAAFLAGWDAARAGAVAQREPNEGPHHCDEQDFCETCQRAFCYRICEVTHRCGQDERAVVLLRRWVARFAKQPRQEVALLGIAETWDASQALLDELDRAVLSGTRQEAE